MNFGLARDRLLYRGVPASSPPLRAVAGKSVLLVIQAGESVSLAVRSFLSVIPAHAGIHPANSHDLSVITNMKVPRQNLVPRTCSAPRDSFVLSGHCPMAKHGWAFGTSVAPSFHQLLHNGNALSGKPRDWTPDQSLPRTPIRGPGWSRRWRDHPRKSDKDPGNCCKWQLETNWSCGKGYNISDREIPWQGFL